MLLKLGTIFLVIGFVESVSWDTSKYFEKLSHKTKVLNSLNLPDVEQRNHLDFPVSPKSQQFDIVPCTPGFTGPNCTIATCYNKTFPILPHDGTLEFGDLIESDFSLSCANSFSFYVDNFINEFFVIINTFDAENPKATVYNPNGDEVQACGDFSVSKSQTIHLFCNGRDVHGTGEYKVQLSADAAKPCVFEVRAPTNLTIDGGFVEDQRDDDVQQIIYEMSNQGIFRFPVEFKNSYLAFKVENENFPVHMEEVHIYENGLFDKTYDLNMRYGCNAPHITVEPYNCSSQNLYHAKFRGYDSDGNRFQRIYDFSCDLGEFFSPTPNDGLTTTPATFCENGGLLYDSGCYCGEFFAGANCETSLCINGGTQFPGGKECLCQTGYSGDHCQHVTCLKGSIDNFEESQSALGFVIRSSESMRVQLNEIAESAEKIVNYYDQHYPIFFQAYVLTVVSDNVIIYTDEYENGQDFLKAVRNISVYQTDTVCEDMLLGGISETLDSSTFKKYPNSPVFVFSDGTANDDFTTIGNLMEQIVSTRAQIFFMLTNSASGKCNVDVSANNYDQLRSISRLSRGLLVQTSLTQLGEATFAIAQDLWQYDTILTNDLEDCRKAPAFQPFFIEQSVDYILLRATGSNLKPIITFPNKTTIAPPLLFSNGDVSIWKTANPPLGAYFLNINTDATHSSLCSYRLLGRSIYKLYTSTTDSLNTDNTNNVPTYKQGSHLVARMDGLYLTDPLDATIEVLVWYNDPVTSERQTLYASSGIWRDSCDYEMYFGVFTCPVAYLPIYINVYTSDVSGQVILRTASSYCSNAAPTPIDPNCLNGGVYYNYTCICPNHFTGYKCQQINCENGGNSLFGVCQCPSGYSGQFCEVVKCFEYNNYGFWGFNHRSLTIIVHDSLTTRSTMRTLNDASSRVVHDIVSQHSRWISNYQLITFNDTAHSLVVDSESGQDLVNGFSKIYKQNQDHSGYSCLSLDFYSTLLEAISHDNVQWGGIVYVFLYGQPKHDIVIYGQILQRIEVNKIQINVVQSSLNPCGQDIALDGLISLAQFSGGSFITATTLNAGNVFNQIPTNYMSGLIYENTVDDCTDGVTFYVPIDDGTQSFTTYIQGFSNADPIFVSPGENDATVTNIFNDLGTNSRMDHVARTCDDGWTSNGHHCFKFSSDQLAWYDALADCHNDGANLATVFNQNDQNGFDSASQNIEFWIGLNDIRKLGLFEWDTIDGKLDLTLNDTKYTNWVQGQPIVNDGRCVLDSNRQNNGWLVRNCSEKHFYICEKHAYASDYIPSNPLINHLARGIWQIRVQAQGQCSISVRSQSTIQLATRFTTNIHDDVGTEEPNRNTDVNRIVVYANGVDNYNAVEYAHFYYDNLTLLQAHTLTHRDNCMFSYISTPFSCPNFYYQMLITGIDDAGYLYQRIVPAACIGGVDENSCTNGGVFYKGTCICPPNFYGDTCEYAFCENGGYISASLNKCNCPNGWDGQFCDIPICTRNQLDVPEIGDVHRTFIVAVDGTSNGDMKTVLDNIEDTINGVLDGIQRLDPAWFTNFVGIVFRDAEAVKANPPLKSTSDVFVSNSSQDLSKQITNELKTNPYTASQQKRDVFTALIKAITHSVVVPNSKVFVITAGNAEDTVARETVLSALALTHSSVHFLFIGDTKPPGDATSYNDPTVTALLETAHITGGTSYQLASPNDLKSTWIAVLASLHNSYYVVTHQISNCSDYQDYIELDSNGTEVVIDVFSQSATDIAVYNTEDKRVDALSIVKSKTNVVAGFKQSVSEPGIWTIDIDYATSNPGPCTLNIRVMSDLEVNLGFTQDVGEDGGLNDGSAVLFPRAGDFENAVVATVNNGGVLTYAQIYDLEETRLAWASPLIKRDGCAYPYVSESTFKCYQSTFVIALDGLDYEGHPFRRTFTIQCDGEIRPPPTHPTIVPTSPESTISTSTSSPSCDPSKTNIDVIIAFDSSSGITDEVFYNTVRALKQIGNAIDIGLNKSRILVGSYDASAHFSGDLNTIDSVDRYLEDLSEIYNFGYTGVYGNNIQAIFDYVVAENNTAPLRPSPVRKFLIFLSSQGWDKGNFADGNENGFADPTASSKNLQQARLEMFAIGLGETANMDQLAAIAKCHQKVKTQDELTNAVNYISNLLCGKTAVC